MTRDLRLVGFALLCWGIGEGFFIYLQPLYLEHLGANPVQIGVVFGLAAIAMTITHIPAGTLSDLIGRKWLLNAGWMSGLFAVVIMYLAEDLPIFIVGMVLYSFTAFVIAPLNAYITAAKGEWSVARAITTSSAFFNTGTIIGSLLGGTIAEIYGIRNIYGFSALMFLISTAVVLSAGRQSVEPIRDSSRYRRLLSNTTLARFLLLALLALFAMYLSWPLTPNFLQNVRNVKLQEIGVLGSFNGLGIVVLNLTLGRLVPRAGFMVSQLAVGASTLLIWLGTGMPWFAIGYLLAGGFRTASALTTAQTEEMVTRAEMGLVYGFAATITGLSLVTAPPVAGLLYRVAPALPYPVSLGVIILSLLMSAFFTSRPRDDTGHIARYPKPETNVGRK